MVAVCVSAVPGSHVRGDRAQRQRQTRPHRGVGGRGDPGTTLVAITTAALASVEHACGTASSETVTAKVLGPLSDGVNVGVATFGSLRPAVGVQER